MSNRSSRDRQQPGQPAGARQWPASALAQALVLDLLERLADEALDQQRARLIRRDAARAQVKQQVLVDLGRRRAVAAHHVVGVDLELRLGIELGILRQHQNLRHLLAVALLRVGPHDHLALEDAVRPVGQHALEQLAALAAGHGVIDHQRGVDMLGAARRGTDPEMSSLAPSPVKVANSAVAHKLRCGGRVGKHDSSPSAPSVASQVARWLVASPASVTLDVRQVRSFAERDIAQRVGLTGAPRQAAPHAPRSMVARAPVAEPDDVARGDEASLRCRARKHQQQRLGQARTFLEANDCAVRHECGVECDDRVLARCACLRPAAAFGLPALQPAIRSRGHRRRPLEMPAHVRAVDEHDAMGVERGQTPPAPRPSSGATVTALPMAGGSASFSARAGRCISIPRCADAAGRAPRTRRWPPCAPPRWRGRPAASRPQPRSSAAEACSALVFVAATVMHAPSACRLASSLARGSLALELGIASLLQLERQLLAARLLDAAVRHHVHLVGHDVVQAAAGSG